MGRGDAEYDFFGFGSRDEHFGRYLDTAIAEFGVSDDVLDGPMLFEVLDCPMESEQVALINGGVAVEQIIDGVPSEVGFEEHACELAQFAIRVEPIELGEDVSFDVANFIGRYVKVGGVHG